MIVGCGKDEQSRGGLLFVYKSVSSCCRTVPAFFVQLKPKDSVCHLTLLVHPIRHSPKEAAVPYKHWPEEKMDGYVAILGMIQLL